MAKHITLKEWDIVVRIGIGFIIIGIQMIADGTANVVINHLTQVQDRNLVTTITYVVNIRGKTD